MLLQENGKTVSFSIIGYEFPQEKPSAQENFNDDANWLKIRIIYAKKPKTTVYTSSCLLTTELAETISGIEKIINGQYSTFSSSYLEPDLHLAIAQVESHFVFQLHFACATARTISIAETMDITKLSEIKKELQTYLSYFPEK